MSFLNAQSTSPITKHDLYELCVLGPEQLVPLLVAIHGGEPLTLAEDFAGTAALCDHWAAQSTKHTAIAVDQDPETLAYHPTLKHVTKIASSVLDPALCMRNIPKADVLHAGNFSIGYMHSRQDLLAYLRLARQRLAPGGVFLCDIYSGEGSFAPCEIHREHWIPDGPHKGKRVRYTWEQRDADPTTGMVTNVLHFRVEQAGKIEIEFEDAFIYHWRLWSIPELRDAMTEAGFATTHVYNKQPDAIDDEGTVYIRPLDDPADPAAPPDLDESFIVFVAGR